SRTGISHCARASRRAPCPRARRGARGGPLSPMDNPRLRLREVSKGRESVEIVIALHDTLLSRAGVPRPNILNGLGLVMLGRRVMRRLCALPVGYDDEIGVLLGLAAEAVVGDDHRGAGRHQLGY